jgi:uncharacterized membrane protein YhaH (DUF805 family)
MAAVEPASNAAAPAAPTPTMARARPWFDTPNVRRVLVLAAIVGLAIGIETVVLHLRTDPMSDLHAYVDAAARLNAGQPLYQQPASVDDPAFYRYPPLLAIAFRPFAALPFDVIAVGWTAVLLASLALTILRLGARRRETWLVMAMLALPTGWALVIGQAQVVVTLMVALGNPLAIALATNVKVFPALVAVWWIGRRDVRGLGWFVAWMAALVLAQLAIEPEATLAYPAFLLSDQVGAVNNFSPYAISPLLWAALVVALAVGAWRLAPKRPGWALAVALSVFATPRLLIYQLSTLVAGLRAPDEPADERP